MNSGWVNGKAQPRLGAVRSTARTGFCAVMLTVAVVAGQTPARSDTVNPLTGLVDAAAQRLQVAEPLAAFKWHAGAAIEDPTRVHQQLAALAAEATASHLDPDYVTTIFVDQINATEAIEYHRFGQWKLDPVSAPAAGPDLSSSRSAIDALNHAMVNQIGLHWELLHSPECADRLDEAQRDVTSARQLDALYRQALSFATQSYCRR